MNQTVTEVLQQQNQQCKSESRPSFEREPSTSTALMRQEEPEYPAVYRKKYGDFANLCKELSFAEIGKLANDMPAALTADVPSFVRLNNIYGDKAAVKWLYSQLKPLLTASAILKDKISNEQIEFLASVIVSTHPTMKLTEFMLFENYFLGGKYEEFYGETSYILAITRSLQQFKKDLNNIYAKIECDRQSQPTDNTPGVTWDEYCKANGIEGRQSPFAVSPEAPVKVKTVRRMPDPLTEVQVAVNSAHAVIDNVYRLDPPGVDSMRLAFQKRYGCWPEEYLAKYENNSEM